jgi:hypothetical protein
MGRQSEDAAQRSAQSVQMKAHVNRPGWSGSSEGDRKEVQTLRNVTVNERTWSADEDADVDVDDDRRRDDDPVAAAGVDYGYARI